MAISKIDFEAVFLMSGDARRDVYVIPPRECKTRYWYYWLLLAASYGLVNTNAKWQELIDGFVHEIGFIQIIYAPQFFYQEETDVTRIFATKIVDEILMTGAEATMKNVFQSVNQRFKLER